ncbi:hypothetical protein MettiDRAFT_2779 [Methanolobus tindarius DSM 2278]|uniref:DUF4209 domain-containing protein n=1 Tax=Methanolobus tindarius DSM 2278 TaxID=1090322 RepID=W9DU03_METTI|nr:DUF4209 domain-containing protein [Methanolobus tindarius]ETA69283.1 hypothetical protein MettiDRAFT_2779 [Methanolobus tindarius DSM 2278]
MFDLDWVKEQLEENDNDHIINMIFGSVIAEIKKAKGNEQHSNEIRTYIQSINHPFFAPLDNYSLWIFEQDYKAAVAAAAKFHENATNIANEKMYLFSVANFQISSDIYKSLGKGHLDNVHEIVEDIFETIKVIENRHDLRWNLELLDILYNNLNLLEKTTYEKIISITENGFQYFYDSKNMHLARSYLEIQRKILNKKGTQKELAAIFEKIAITYETDAELRKDEHAVVCAFLKEALGYYELAGNHPKIEEVKLRLKAESQKVEYSKNSVDVKLPMDHINKLISYFSTLEFDKIPLEIALYDEFVPKKKDMMQLTEEILATYPLIGIIPTVTTCDGNDVKACSSPEAIKNHQYRFQYSNHMKFIGVVLNIIFKRLTEKEMFSSEVVFRYLSNNELLVQDDLETAKTGIEAYFKSDYVTCMHILVPKLENIIRNLMYIGGIPTTITDMDGIREGDLGNYLRKEEVQNIVGEDFNDFLKILFIEKDSINLRNRLAHGLLKYIEFNEVFASLILFVYLRLGAVELISEEKSSDSSL